jgi:hypothetical protein
MVIGAVETCGVAATPPAGTVVSRAALEQAPADQQRAVALAWVLVADAELAGQVRVDGDVTNTISGDGSVRTGAAGPGVHRPDLYDPGACAARGRPWRLMDGGQPAGLGNTISSGTIRGPVP